MRCSLARLPEPIPLEYLLNLFLGRIGIEHQINFRLGVRVVAKGVVQQMIQNLPVSPRLFDVLSFKHLSRRRAVLRLAGNRRSFPHEMHRYMREDLATGFDQGRFEVGPDEITLDLITGLILMSIRRIVRGDARPDYAERVLTRALTTLGVSKDEATILAANAATDFAGCAEPSE